LFVDFIVTNVLPQTPISVFIGVLLLVGFMAIKSGLENLARCCELVVLLGLPFAFLIFLAALIENWRPENLLPFAYMDLKSFSLGLFSSSYILGKMLPVLSLAFFGPRREKTGTVMLLVIFSYVALMSTTTLATLMTLDTTMSNIATFPTFSTVRLLHVADFIQNIDIIFIGIWIMGIFATATIPWFMACYTTQQLFALKDYRFLAAPSSLIIGVFSILMSKNILELLAVSMYIIPLLYSIIFILLPFLLFLLTLLKPYPESETLAEPILKAESSA
ncbi:MAG: GerAB/ArcD/ProY family transporter, partial [Syntrophomonas sp.]|nr:GerAB/ArcD/ProY family transporter [Syntrophomonas sp.]